MKWCVNIKRKSPNKEILNSFEDGNQQLLTKKSGKLVRFLFVNKILIKKVNLMIIK